MIFGLIYNKYAIIESKQNHFDLYINWQNHLNSKEISKKCLISSPNFFIEKLQQTNKNWKKSYIIEKIIYKLSNPINYQLNYYPKVSIIMSVYNGEKTVEKSIKSILKQTYPNIELIIIDDKSEDNTLNVLNRYRKRDNVIILENNKNCGVYCNRNLGIKNATGKIIGIQDADDISDPSRIAKSIDYLIKKDVEFVLTNAKNINKIVDEVSSIKVAMATFICDRVFFDKYGLYDDSTRHSGDLEIIDRAYFIRFGEYKFKNFWYWLNYTAFEPTFYGHIYENLYYIGTDGDRITDNNRIQKRQKYLNGRRKFYINKNNE